MSRGEPGIRMEDVRWLLRRVVLWTVLVGALKTMIPFSHEAAMKPIEGRRRCAANLRQIGLAVEFYRNRNEGLLPDLDDLALLDRIREVVDLEPDVFVCPGGMESASNGEALSEASCSYVARRNTGALRLRAWDRRGNVPIAADRWGHGTGPNVLFADGHVEEVDDWTYRQECHRMLGDRE